MLIDGECNNDIIKKLILKRIMHPAGPTALGLVKQSLSESEWTEHGSGVHSERLHPETQEGLCLTQCNFNSVSRECIEIKSKS
jgi:hypothetical protein